MNTNLIYKFLKNSEANETANKKSLTDFEILGLHQNLNLADGHAYQEVVAEYQTIVDNMSAIWELSGKVSIPRMELRFRESFAKLANSPSMAAIDSFKICPTASNSIDIIGKVLSVTGRAVKLIEPTFDNLALLLWRNKVKLEPVSEIDFLPAIAQGNLPQVLNIKAGNALFLVNPNNPTGQCLNSESFRIVVDFCVSRDILLLIDNSFRFYNRKGFDDYRVLRESGVSFIAFEDTGKVWSTHDLKASLLFYSSNLEPLVTEIYNELYLCDSRFKLAILEQFITATNKFGLSQTIWKQVDTRRAFLRKALEDTEILVDKSAVDSQISVEWLYCGETGLTDNELTGILAEKGLMILPGRQFFWYSKSNESNHHNIRLALMKPFETFTEAVEVFCSATSKSQAGENYIKHVLLTGDSFSLKCFEKLKVAG